MYTFSRLFSWKRKASLGQSSSQGSGSSKGKTAEKSDGKEIPAQEKEAQAADGAASKEQMYEFCFLDCTVLYSYTWLQRCSVPTGHNSKPRTVHQLGKICYSFHMLKDIDRLQHVPRRHSIWPHRFPRPSSPGPYIRYQEFRLLI